MLHDSRSRRCLNALETVYWNFGRKMSHHSKPLRPAWSLHVGRVSADTIETSSGIVYFLSLSDTLVTTDHNALESILLFSRSDHTGIYGTFARREESRVLVLPAGTAMIHQCFVDFKCVVNKILRFKVYKIDYCFSPNWLYCGKNFQWLLCPSVSLLRGNNYLMRRPEICRSLLLQTQAVGGNLMGWGDERNVCSLEPLHGRGDVSSQKNCILAAMSEVWWDRTCRPVTDAVHPVTHLSIWLHYTLRHPEPIVTRSVTLHYTLHHTHPNIIVT